MIDKLLVFFVSGLDRRRIDLEHTPYLYELTQKFPNSIINNFPEVDLHPTLVTGLSPHEHGICQVRIKSGSTPQPKLLMDSLPDIVTTTAQCFIHMLTGSYNLAAVPYWRRRRFEILKRRYEKKVLSNFLKVNEKDTLFNIIGQNNCRYIYLARLEQFNTTKPQIFNGNHRFELFETHAIDTISHWNIFDNQKMIDSYNEVDAYLKTLHDECSRNGITLMILGEHGMEPVKKRINIKQIIRELGIRDSEITYYIEASKIRFWFHSQNAREKILNYLRDNNDGSLFSRKDMEQFKINFKDDSFGEYYFVLNAGNIFFPNDFHHPIANYYLALTNKMARNRLLHPAHRGNHGYLPHNDSEKGTLLLADEHYKTQNKEVTTIDVVPTILSLLGYEQPNELKGKSAFYQ